MDSIDDENNERHVGFEGCKWEVHKFGGTSVASAECFRTVAAIVEEHLGIVDGDDEPFSTTSDEDVNLAVVVSAVGGKPKVTDLLLSTVTAAAKRESEKVKQIMNQIMNKHQTCIDELFPENPEERERLLNAIQSDMGDVNDILKTVSVMKWQAKRISELVSGYGELWSAQILAALLRQRAQKRTEQMKALSSSSLHETEQYKHHEFCFLDARRVITIDEEAIQDGSICWGLSLDNMQQVHKKETAFLRNQFNNSGDYLLHYVVTGYVASNTDGVATTLQRDGSDYSAAIMGRLLQSNNITIWTDVNGVLSADPRRVPSAHVIPEVSYNEAMELAYFGAKVIHPKTMQPAISSQKQIPIYIRNTFCSSFPGTRIYTSSTTTTDRDKCVCGFSSVDHMALINVEGSGLIGVPGVARRMFATLERLGVNIVLISQASSEHSITFATNEDSAGLAKEAIEEEFRRELKANRISSVDVQSPCSIIAAVGDGMSHTSGVAGRFFSALGDAKINVLAISQGCSERNISAVVMTKESTRALRAVHAAFRLSQTVVRVGVVGMNELGISLVNLLEDQRSKLKSAFDVDLEVCAIVADGNSKEVVVLQNDGDGTSDSITVRAFNKVTGGSLLLGAPNASVGFDDREEDLARVATGGLSSMLQYLFNDECPHHVVFDCTNDEVVSSLHAEWLQEGVHVVTANNTGLSGSREQRQSISDAEVVHGKLSAQYLREVTVGGGLPIVSTLRNLLHSGDKIRRVDGILSVSLSYIMFRVSPPPGFSNCSNFDQESSQGAFRGDLSMSPQSNIGQACSFSEAVKEAIALGLMEEHPGKDLSNEYTARVLMVLSKELGLDQYHDTAEIQETSAKFFANSDGDYESFTGELDQRIKDRVSEAESRGCVLRHISSVDVKSKDVEIKVAEVPNNHVFAVTPPSCECVRFFTQRHKRYPLIIQGPSAGADSTASALLAELLNLMRSKVGPRSGALSRTGSSAYLN